MSSLKRRLYWYCVLLIIIAPGVTLLTTAVVMFQFFFGGWGYIRPGITLEAIVNGLQFCTGVLSLIVVMAIDSQVRE